MRLWGDVLTSWIAKLFTRLLLGKTRFADLSSDPKIALPILGPFITTDINYSDKYSDDLFEYRHVTLPTAMGKKVPRNHLVRKYEKKRMRETSKWETFVQIRQI